MKTPAPDLSVCMIVKNEAQQIAEAISNFRAFADEIIVVDTGSTDHTKAIAERLTPHVIDYPWCDDFSSARNFSLQKAQGRYIVWLDADDRLDRDMQQKLRELKPHLDGSSVFYFILHDTDASGLTRSCYQLRCFPRMPEIRFKGRVHEQVYPSVMAAGLRTVATDIVVSHHGYQDPKMSFQKAQRNLSLLEKEREEGRDDEHLHYYLALTYNMLGRDIEAIRAMERALFHLEKQIFHPPRKIDMPDFRPTMEAYLFLTPLYLKEGSRHQALCCLAKADSIATKDARSHFHIGCLYQELNQHTLAIQHFGLSLKAESLMGFLPASPLLPHRDILLFIAVSLLSLDQESKALEVLQAACDSGRQIHEGWEWLGFRAIHLKQFQISLKAYENALAAGGVSADGYCNLGLLYGYQGFSKKAMAHYQAALQKDPNHKDARTNAAHLCLSLGYQKNAKRLFQQLVEEGVQDVDILLALASIAVREKDWCVVQTTTQMLKEIPSLHDSCDKLEGVRFYTAIARQFASQQKPKLAKWASDIALGLPDHVFLCSWQKGH
jgi:tetratricopeptide (TPR) repeat protein